MAYRVWFSWFLRSTRGRQTDMSMDRRKFLIGMAGTGGLLLGAGSALAAPAQPRKDPPKPTPRKKLVIAIDAGHGGKDPGAIGASGSYEKDITLGVAQELARKLEATGRYQPILTRPKDHFIALGDRVKTARTARAELMISLHADSAGNPDKRGFSVYTLADQASDAFAAALAKRENAVDQIGGVDLGNHTKTVRNILLDLMAREVSHQSTNMAQCLLRTMSPPFAPLQNPHRQANFAVLRAPDVPSILVEMGFMSSPSDEKQLIQRSVQGQIAERLTRSINSFFQV